MFFGMTDIHVDADTRSLNKLVIIDKWSQ